MLNLVLGRAGTGKTEFVFSKIKDLIDEGNENIILLTPEQSSFLSERRLLSDMGESKIGFVQSLSFSRLSNEISRLYGGDNLPILKKGARAVMMKRAIATVQDSLELFENNIASNSFINSMLNIYDEMKSCRVTYDDIINASEKVDKEILKLKLRDIALIIDAYDALIEGVYFDSENELTRLYEKLITLDYFKGKTVFIDGFSGFVAQEYKIIEVILQQAENVYITFCTDDADSKDENSIFSYVNSNIRILKDVSQKVGCGISDDINLNENKRANNDELKAVEKYAFSNSKEIIDKTPENISVYNAKNISDECDRVALNISNLLRDGLRARDITVICRSLDLYEKELQFSFDKFKIPYFNDERQSISSQPLIMLVSFLLRVKMFSFRSEDIFSLLKTGLTELSDNEINALENYAFVWGITGSKWKNEFTESPRGFCEELSENDKVQLKSLNKNREYIVDIITKFSKSCSGGTAKDYCRALYFALIDYKADKMLRELAIKLEENGKSYLSLQQERIWDLLMEILDKLALTGEEEKMSVKDFYKLFNLMISNEDLGALPEGLDNVQLGSADRIRCNNPKVIFIVGASEGDFPQSIISSGILSESDRASLVSFDFKLYSYGKALNAQEMYFAYMAVSSATDKLFVSFISGGEKDRESSIVRGIKEIFPSLEYNEAPEEYGVDDVSSDESAFEILASHYNDNNAFIASLKQYFSTKPEYSGRLEAVKRLNDNDEITIKDDSLSLKLFSNNMYLSASRIEDYYNCAFRYFCKFGLNARPLMKAELDPMQTGTAIHYVLETIIKEVGSKGLAELSREEITVLVNNALNDYLNNKLGNPEAFPARFKYQFLRLSKMIVFVVERLSQEFAQSDFEAKAFELRIGDVNAGDEVNSKVIALDDGGTIRIKGAVDRVDVYEKDGRKYIRVVDYKSGPKYFSVADIINGLNLQMFIYLFTLTQSNSEYNGISSGVLYMHSARKIHSVDRNNADDVASKENEEFKMRGIVLNDEDNEIVQHMEHDLKGKFVPAKFIKNKGALSGNIVSLSQIGAISKKVDMMINQMGTSLHKGLISQNPAWGANHKDTCDRCDYRAVCYNRKEIEVRELENLSFNEALDKIVKESENA